MGWVKSTCKGPEEDVLGEFRSESRPVLQRVSAQQVVREEEGQGHPRAYQPGRGVGTKAVIPTEAILSPRDIWHCLGHILAVTTWGQGELVTSRRQRPWLLNILSGTGLPHSREGANPKCSQC